MSEIVTIVTEKLNEVSPIIEATIKKNYEFEYEDLLRKRTFDDGEDDITAIAELASRLH